MHTVFARISPSVVQILSIIFITIVAALFSFQGMWNKPAVHIFHIIGAMSAFVALFSILYKRLYLQIDIKLLFVFFTYLWLSSVFVYGLSIAFFHSPTFCIWLIIFAVYCIVQIVPNSEKFLNWYSFVSALSLGIMCFGVLYHAGQSLFMEIPIQDTVRGCFRLGRLCGITNANNLAFACYALIIMSVFGFIRSSKLIKVFYLLTASTGWLCLGLTNSRTTIIGLAFTCALFSFIMIRKHFSSIHSKLKSVLIAVFISLLVMFGVLASFNFTLPIYRSSMMFLNHRTDNPNLNNNLLSLSYRGLLDDNGTLTDRTLIWTSCIKSSFKNVRRALLGTTQLGIDRIGGIYAGRHDITVAHAHNAYLEILRRYGLIGLSIWLALLIIWCRNGIKQLFCNGEKSSILFLLCSVAGILLISTTEPYPLARFELNYLDFPFLIAGAYCIRYGRVEL